MGGQVSCKMYLLYMPITYTGSSPADMSSLHDVYELVDEDNAKKQTSYILQFL